MIRYCDIVVRVTCREVVAVCDVLRPTPGASHDEEERREEKEEEA